jgi:hypothetical protein
MKNYPPFPVYTPQYTLVVPEEEVLYFDSRFESGNLSKAIKISDNEYNLLLNFDTETQGHTQWYFFSVKPFKKAHTVRFNIINLMKFESLYNEGMKPAVYSTAKRKHLGLDWHRDGFNVGYFQNSFKRKSFLPDCPERLRYFYTLSFCYTFEYEEDEVFFAYSNPYTYSDLKDYLLDLERNEKYKKFLRIDSFCKTLAGNNCFLLTITNKIKSYTGWKEESEKLQKSSAARRYIKIKELKEETKLKILETKSSEGKDGAKESIHSIKKGVFFTARVHPGEPNSSFMIRGAIEFLLSDCKEAKSLRKNFVFKIVPMLNPDGVVYGNYRCSLLGVDLNRRWKHPNAVMHPTIFFTKKLIQIFSEEREVVLFTDFHGHSIKRDVFAYACCYKRCDVYKVKENLLIRLIPFVLAQMNPFFSYENSHFRVERSKMGTSRVVNFKENKILTSYTIEASFFGNSSSNDHFSSKDLEKIGQDLCLLCSVFCSKREFTSKMTELTQHLKKQTRAKLEERQDEVNNLNENQRFSEVFRYSNEISDPVNPSFSDHFEPFGSADLSENHSLKPFKTLKTFKHFKPSKISTVSKLNSVENNRNEDVFCIKDELKHFDSLDSRALCILEEDDDSGGSDSQASFNDEKKIRFYLKSQKKHRKKKLKNSESPARSEQILQNSSLPQVKNSITPETLLRYRPKSRGCLKRRVEATIKQIIPTKIMLKSPFLDENPDLGSQNSLSPKPTVKVTKHLSPLKPMRKLDEILRDLGLAETPLSYKSSLMRKF